jgi:hypothetical protein
MVSMPKFTTVRTFTAKPNAETGSITGSWSFVSYPDVVYRSGY